MAFMTPDLDTLENVRTALPLIGRFLRAPDGKAFQFLGILSAADDLQYCLHAKTGELALPSCVFSLEAYGYALAPDLRPVELLPVLADEDPSGFINF